MKRYRLDIEYDGTNYVGWQIQPNGISIQGEIERGLKELNKGKRVSLVGSGRTDSGVHALGQVAHFDLTTNHSPGVIKKAINAKTSRDILIHNCSIVDDDFHARFQARRRTYCYNIMRKPSAIFRDFAWLPELEFDEEILHKCAELLIGVHDFSSLCKKSTEAKSKICEIYNSSWNNNGKMLIYTIVGNRFLHSMVRMIVGSMMLVARGKKYKIEDFKNLIKNEKVDFLVFTAPAKGLYLNKVEY